jgi:hypothetical protein
MKTTKSIQLTSAELVTLLAGLQLARYSVANLEEYKEFNDKLHALETTVRQQS